MLDGLAHLPWSQSRLDHARTRLPGVEDCRAHSVSCSRQWHSSSLDGRIARVVHREGTRIRTHERSTRRSIDPRAQTASSAREKRAGRRELPRATNARMEAQRIEASASQTRQKRIQQGMRVRSERILESQGRRMQSHLALRRADLGKIEPASRGPTTRKAKPTRPRRAAKTCERSATSSVERGATATRPVRCADTDRKQRYYCDVAAAAARQKPRTRSDRCRLSA